MDEAVRRISWIHFLRKIVLEGWSVLLKTWKMFVLTRGRYLNVHLWLRKGRSMLKVVVDSFHNFALTDPVCVQSILHSENLMGELIDFFSRLSCFLWKVVIVSSNLMKNVSIFFLLPSTTEQWMVLLIGRPCTRIDDNNLVRWQRSVLLRALIKALYIFKDSQFCQLEWKRCAKADIVVTSKTCLVVKFSSATLYII